MAFRLKLNERPTAALHRLVLAQAPLIDRCLSRNHDQIADVHEARKTVKRLRSLLRLLRPGLRRIDFEQQNKHLGDVGRMLSPVRDRDVLLAQIAELAKTPFDLPEHEVAALMRIASAASTSTTASSAVVRKSIRQLLGDFRAVVARTTVSPDDISTVFAGLEDAYRRCRRSFARAYAEPSDEAFHDWRKDVQRHWRHVALLARAWPETAAARIALGREIAESLGRDQDLGLLERFLHSPAASSLDGDLRGRVLAMTTRRRLAIRTALEPRGRLLLAETPGAYRRRIEACWAAARLRKKRGTLA